MAAIEIRADFSPDAEGVSEPLVASGSALSIVNLTEQAHLSQDFIDPAIASRIQHLEERIAADKKELVDYKSELKQKRIENQRKAGQRAGHMRRLLEDPNSGFHDIYRSVLLNAEQANGSLEDKNTFDQAHYLGKSLLNLNQVLENSSIPQPLVIVRNIPSERHPLTNMQLDYGYTQPNTGANVYNSGTVDVVYGNNNEIKANQSWLGVNTIEDPPLHAIMQDSDNSHYIYDDERVIKVNTLGARRKGKLSEADITPITDNAQIPLPIANLYQSRTETPLIIYDKPNGLTEKIILPENLQGLRGQTVLLIGELAIIEGLSVLPAQIEIFLGEEKGRVAEAMVKTVVRDELGIKN